MAEEFGTAGTIISLAANDLGLVSAEIVDPYASTDQNVLQLVSLLSQVCRKMHRARNWSQFKKTATIATVASTAAYDLPTDFGRIVDGTMWDRTQRLPALGPLSDQEWHALQAQATTPAPGFYFRHAARQITIYPTPSSVRTIAYEYISYYWAANGSPTVLDDSLATVANSYVWFDLGLAVAALKLAFLRAKGFDTTAAQEDYDELWGAVSGEDGSAPNLSLGGSIGVRTIDGRNVPDTGYGA